MKVGELYIEINGIYQPLGQVKDVRIEPEPLTAELLKKYDRDIRSIAGTFDFHITAYQFKVLDRLFGGCRQKCECGQFTCTVREHTKEVGPFHVYKQHTCAREQDWPMGSSLPRPPMASDPIDDREQSSDEVWSPVEDHQF